MTYSILTDPACKFSKPAFPLSQLQHGLQGVDLAKAVCLEMDLGWSTGYSSGMKMLMKPVFRMI